MGLNKVAYRTITEQDKNYQFFSSRQKFSDIFTKARESMTIRIQLYT